MDILTLVHGYVEHKLKTIENVPVADGYDRDTVKHYMGRMLKCSRKLIVEKSGR